MEQLKVFTRRTTILSRESSNGSSERFIIAELIREKVLHLTREEVPHSVAVVIDAIQKREGGAVYINATIVVERASQKESSSENKEKC